MSKPTGYIVRPKDMKALVRQLNRTPGSYGETYEAARTLIGWAEPQQTQLPPVSVASLALPLDEPVNVPADPDVEPQPYDMPSPEADALDRIEAVIQSEEYSKEQWDAIFPVFQILRETGARENWPTSEDVATLGAALRAVLAECRDMADAAGHRDRIRDAIAAALGGEPR